MLETSGKQCQSADMIAAADFIIGYGKDFGISELNLHGDNNYKFSEFALRRELVKKALKLLVLDGLINVSTSKNGFTYSISQKGINYINKFTSNYADSYRKIGTKVREYLMEKSEREILSLINQLSISSLQGSDLNE